MPWNRVIRIQLLFTSTIFSREFSAFIAKLLLQIRERNIIFQKTAPQPIIEV